MVRGVKNVPRRISIDLDKCLHEIADEKHLSLTQASEELARRLNEFKRQNKKVNMEIKF